MAKITGLGGVFLKTKKKLDVLMKWYEEVLELEISDCGINFLTPNELTLMTFESGDGEAVLNFTVDDIDEYLSMLKGKGVPIHKDIETFEYGKFLQILDPFDQIVELWEPVQDAYVKMVKEEIKTYKDNQ